LLACYPDFHRLGFIMTKRLYYDNSEIRVFDSVVEEVMPGSPEQPRPAVVLRETAFYPTSGGQVNDTGWLTLEGAERLRVTEVADAEDGRVLHYLQAPAKLPAVGIRVGGSIDPEHAATLRTACALGGVYRAFSNTYGFVSYGRRLLLD
jgi:Ser-tRNA(Ala) deacylase AlaX